MKPKEIQKKLGVSADCIKHFKKEGVFSPENPPSGNRATNYTDDDYKNLKFLIVLSKSGFTCSDIRKLQDGDWNFAQAIEYRREHIEAELERKRNSLSLLKELQDDNVSFEEFRTDYYWEEIREREEKGEEFVGWDDSYRPVDRTRLIECPYCGKAVRIDLEEYESERTSDNNEIGMGEDITYWFDSEDEIKCLDCGKGYRVHGWIREYPVGAFDSEDIIIEKIDEET